MLGPDAPTEPHERRHTIRSRPGLPSGRAVLGGLLVSVAGVGVFAAYAGAQQAPQATAVVVTTDLPAGHRLSADDLATRPVELPPATTAATFTTVDALLGAVTLSPLDAEELVQHSAVLTNGADDEPVHEFSFPVAKERAVDGEVRRGERIDLLATYGTGNDAYTVVLARDARVVELQSSGTSGLGGAGNLVLTVALGSADQVLDVAHASQVADLTIVRATRAAGTADGRDRASAPGASSAGATRPGSGTGVGA